MISRTCRILVFVTMAFLAMPAAAQHFSEHPYPMDSARPGIRKVFLIWEENPVYRSLYTVKYEYYE